MAVALIVALAILASKHLSRAAPTTSPYDNPRCTYFNLPITASSSDAYVFDIVHPDDNINATALAVQLSTVTTPSPAELVTKNITVSGTYNIAAQLCVPQNGSKKETLQIASHGAIFDKRYWDIRYQPSEYSWVDNMLDAGYSILTYDRIGVGQSDKPDAYTVVQTRLQVDILGEITKLARSGGLMKYVPGSAAKNATFNKFIHIGHSQGSAITLNFLSEFGELSDGAIITGELVTTKRSPPQVVALDVQYAAQANPKLFGDFGNGYVVPTPGGLQAGFLSTFRNYTLGLGGFNHELFEYSDKIKQPMACTEIISSEVLGFSPAPNFTAPLQFVSGEYDFVGCNGDCRGAWDPKVTKDLFPGATHLDHWLQPGTGHGLPFHLGAKYGFQKSIKWLESVGL